MVNLGAGSKSGSAAPAEVVGVVDKEGPGQAEMPADARHRGEALIRMAG